MTDLEDLVVHVTVLYVKAVEEAAPEETPVLPEWCDPWLMDEGGLPKATPADVPPWDDGWLAASSPCCASPGTFALGLPEANGGGKDGAGGRR